MYIACIPVYSVVSCGFLYVLCRVKRFCSVQFLCDSAQEPGGWSSLPRTSCEKGVRCSSAYVVQHWFFFVDATLVAKG